MMRPFIPALRILFLVASLLRGAAVAAAEAVLFSTDFAAPTLDLANTWHLEGTGDAWIEDGRLCLQEHDEGKGVVLWLRETMPDTFRLRFTVRFNNNRGIGVIFFAARVKGGGELLTPESRRTGAYDEYIRGAVDSYSLSFHRYWPDGRNNPGSNLRRNAGFHLLDQARPDPILEAERDYRVEITKRGKRLTVRVDGRQTHAVVDAGEHGPAHGAGKIGFRLRGDASCVLSLDDVQVEALMAGQD